MARKLTLEEFKTHILNSAEVAALKPMGQQLHALRVEFCQRWNYGRSKSLESQQVAEALRKVKAEYYGHPVRVQALTMIAKKLQFEGGALFDYVVGIPF